MALALVVDSLDAVPEAARGAYVEKAGKFHLDAEIEDVAGIKAKNVELLGKNKTLAERAKLLGDRSAEDIQADLELAAKFKIDRAKAEGDFGTLKEQLVAQHTTELKKVSDRTVQVEGKLYDVLAKREAELAIRDAKGKAKVLLPHLLPFIKVVEVDGDFVAQVVDAKGSPRIADGQGTAMTIKQLVEQFAADQEFEGAFEASGSSGSGARNEGGKGGAKGAVIIPKNATPQEYRRMKDDAVKRGVPYSIGD